MDWVQLATFILINLAFNITLWLWSRSESRADLRNFSGEMHSYFKDFSNEIRLWKEEVNKEMKDFHGRLCAIEERRNK